MISKFDGWLRRMIVIVGGGVVLVSVWCIVLRWQSVREAAGIAPGVAVTSGCEEESLRAVWDVAHGQPAYTDSGRIPFQAAYFNWLFYQGYGQLLRPFVATAGADALLLHGRVLTGLFLAIGFGGFLWLVRSRSPWPGWGIVAVAAFVFTGPLVSWWALTLRPDVPALALECLGMLATLGWYRKRPMAAALAGAVFCAGAWSFKQSCVLGGATIVLFLLWRREWRAAMVAAGVQGAVMLLVWWLAGPAYRLSMQDMAQGNLYLLAHGVNNLREMLLKASPLWLMALGGLLPGAKPLEPASPDAETGLRELRDLAVIGLGVSLPLSFVASCKIGAWAYYFFFPQMMLAGLVLSRPLHTAWRQRLAVVALAACLVLQLLAATGVRGLIDLRPQAELLAVRWHAWQTMAEPRYAYDTRLNLPWLNPGSPAFVVAYDYAEDRIRGRAFEANGVGGLIEQGYFASLLLPAEVTESCDGGKLTAYRRGETAGGMNVWLRIRDGKNAIENDRSMSRQNPSGN